MLTALTITGAAYLVWLGIAQVARPGPPPSGTASVERSSLGVFLRGAGISGLNPKGLLLYFALIPQFTEPAGPWPIAALLVLERLTT